jgi:hypothetical protein
MAGVWRMDAAASDDFDHKLTALLQEARRHDMPRGAMGGEVTSGQGQGQGQGGGQGQGPGGAPVIQPLPTPMEDPEKMRTRLGDDLRPAQLLRINFIGDGLEITRDAEPTRQFLPATTISRIDSSGAYTISCGWDQNAFVIHAKYTNHGARNWRIEHDSAGDTLRVTLTGNHPEYGHVEVHTLYRRSAEGTP